MTHSASETRSRHSSTEEQETPGSVEPYCSSALAPTVEQHRTSHIAHLHQTQTVLQRWRRDRDAKVKKAGGRARGDTPNRTLEATCWQSRGCARADAEPSLTRTERDAAGLGLGLDFENVFCMQIYGAYGMAFNRCLFELLVEMPDDVYMQSEGSNEHKWMANLPMGLLGCGEYLVSVQHYCDHRFRVKSFATPARRSTPVLQDEMLRGREGSFQMRPDEVLKCYSGNGEVDGDNGHRSRQIVADRLRRWTPGTNSAVLHTHMCDYPPSS
ncbi:hypothetical protein BDW22DRAFT_1419455 [Trametopsis cervina]|nr:hypothetical protein BDW22DRAFT_1419455 [Trametopsis cervina]